MDSSTLLNRSKTPNITPKITKINNLSIASAQARKSSTKLVKVFEKGTYQKKTQLSVLNRYKKRLESIQKQNDRSFGRKRKVKVKLPSIKKYVGSFFTPGSTNDPLKAIGALAAFTAFQKGSKGDWGGALGSGLIAAGLFGAGTFGPSLIKGGMNMMKGGGGVAASAGAGGGGVSTPWWSKNTKSLSRSNQSYAKFIQGNANIGDRARLVRRGMISPIGMFSRGGPEEVAKQVKIGKAFGRFGKAIIPGVGAAVGAVDATIRAQEGDITGATIAGTSAALDALAAASAATGIGLPVAGLLSIASFGLDVVNLVRDLSGASEKESQKNKANQPDRLKAQTEQQKALVEKKKDEKGKLTFSKTLNSYGRAVSKFEDFAKGFTGVMGMGGEQSGIIETGNRGIETGQELQDVEATGGEVPGTPYSSYGPRGKGMHHGNDYAKPSGTAISVIQPGTVTVADMNYEPNGWGAVVEIRHPDGSLSRYAHLSKIYVAAGTPISPGQVIGLTGGVEGAPGSGNSRGPHLHFEYETSAGRVDPTSVAPKIFRFGGNVRVKQKSQQQLQQQGQTPTSTTLSPLFQRQQLSGLSIGQGGFRVNGTPALSQARPRRMPDVSQNLPYQEGYVQAQPMVVPYPVIRQQQAAASAPSAPMMFPGPSEQQLLNSFYKKVLLNTVQ